VLHLIETERDLPRPASYFSVAICRAATARCLHADIRRKRVMRAIKNDKRITECRISLFITLESNQQELQFCQIAPYQGDEKRQWLDDSDCQAFGLYSDTHVAARVLLSCGMIISAFGKQLASSNLLFISAARAQRIHHASNRLKNHDLAIFFGIVDFLRFYCTKFHLEIYLILTEPPRGTPRPWCQVQKGVEAQVPARKRS
jgi:hypothetical protein